MTVWRHFVRCSLPPQRRRWRPTVSTEPARPYKASVRLGGLESSEGLGRFYSQINGVATSPSLPPTLIFDPPDIYILDILDAGAQKHYITLR